MPWDAGSWAGSRHRESICRGGNAAVAEKLLVEQCGSTVKEDMRTSSLGEPDGFPLELTRTGMSWCSGTSVLGAVMPPALGLNRCWKK